MAYRIQFGETVGESIRRIGGEQIGKALDDLDGGDRHEAVHEFRKRCKKIRALLRLVRASLGHTYDAENRWFRDAARSVSELRDATSMIETCNELMRHYRDDIDHQLLEPMIEALRERREKLADSLDLDDRLDDCRAAMRAARERAGSWELDDEGFDAVAAGLEKTYKRGRKAFDRACSEGTVGARHEWRKRAKYHRYHLRLLGDLWRPVLDPWRDQLHALSDLLGEDHDLAVLGRTLETSDEIAGVVNRPAVAGLIFKRRAELEAAARPLGEKLFAEKPSRLVDRLGAYWVSWRAQKIIECGFDAEIQSVPS